MKLILLLLQACKLVLAAPWSLIDLKMTLGTNCGLTASPNSNCFAKDCQATIQMSPSLDMTEAVSITKQQDFALLHSPTCLGRTNETIYNEMGEDVFI